MSNESAEFSFTWQALKLLGKSLYSNPWAAISELVANGFDAGAQNVFVMLDLSAGKDAVTLEVLDDGSGMDDRGIRDYVQVGRNKRFEVDANTVSNPMGRKGIGKLAALYLSDEYYLSTKHSTGSSTWHLEIAEDQHPDSKPELVMDTAFGDFILQSKWENIATGTLISVRNIDLQGSGAAALSALETKLANQFLLTSMDSRKIQLCIRHRSDEAISFRPVEKQVAFRNYMLAYSSYDRPQDFPNELDGIIGNEVALKVGTGTAKVPVKTGSLADISGNADNQRISGFVSMTDNNGDRSEYPYSLTGWIAVHATIDKELARSNDDRFVKNKFYNPSQIRLYVRNKLAAENVLQLLGLTQAFANYVEGEISFDLLDEDNLPDIATTNRQGFDENDLRIERLQEILKPIVQSLIRERESTMKKLREDRKEEETEIQGRAKRAFLREVKQELDKARIDDDVSNDLLIPIANKLSGSNVNAKSSHRIFLSHSSGDKDLLDVIYYSLLDKGVQDEEVFYTSKSANLSDEASYVQLKDLMRECITDSKTRILYVTSPAFTQSTYCLFEGGAGWATRGIGEYDLLTTSFSDAPAFLHNSQVIQGLINPAGKLILSREVYVALVTVLNRLIDHLNEGRVINGKSVMIERFSEEEFPPPHEIVGSERDYMDSNITKMWDSYIDNIDRVNRYPNAR